MTTKSVYNRKSETYLANVVGTLGAKRKVTKRKPLRELAFRLLPANKRRLQTLYHAIASRRQVRRQVLASCRLVPRHHIACQVVAAHLFDTTAVPQDGQHRPTGFV